MSKIDQIHIRAVMMYVEDRSHNSILNYVEMSDQIHIRAVMLCFEDVEDGKRTYTHILAHNLNT